MRCVKQYYIAKVPGRCFWLSHRTDSLITKTYCLASKYIRKSALINCAKRMHTHRMVSIQLIQRIVAKTLM